MNSSTNSIFSSQKMAVIIPSIMMSSAFACAPIARQPKFQPSAYTWSKEIENMPMSYSSMVLERNTIIDAEQVIHSFAMKMIDSSIDLNDSRVKIVDDNFWDLLA